MMITEEPTSGEIRSAKEKAVGGARPKCNIGKSCSAACITRSDFCLVDLPDGPAASLPQVKDLITELRGSGYRFKADLLERGLKEVDKLKKKLPQFIREGNQAKYNEIINKIEDKRRDLKSLAYVGTKPFDKPLFNSPASWEKAQKTYASYQKAVDSLKAGMGKAAKGNKRKLYDKLERRLEAVQNKVGRRLGFEDTLKKGEIWDEVRGLLKNPEVRKLGISLKDVPNMWWIIRERLKNPFIGNRFDDSPNRVHALLKERKGKYKSSDIDYIDRASLIALKNYTRNGYSYIRKAQAGKLPVGDTPLKQKYWERETKKLLRMASRIEEILKDLPKPEVEKYRGMRADDDVLAKLIRGSKGKKTFTFPAMTSWSNSWEIGKKFADSEPASNSNVVNRVFFRTVNKRGSPIGPLSALSFENEILTPSNTSFKHSRYYVYTSPKGEAYHIFEIEEL